MACKKALKRKAQMTEAIKEEQPQAKPHKNAALPRVKMIFGVDSKIESTDILQNNLTLFEWAARNKTYPDFWGRNITGDHSLTKEEIAFIHDKGCMVAAICQVSEACDTEEQGMGFAMKMIDIAHELGIRDETAIFMEIDAKKDVTMDFMHGYAKSMFEKGYTPAFKANTDAVFSFDREYSRGVQVNSDLFKKCPIWAVAPSLKEYERVTTTHLIHPDNWIPYAPSGTTRGEIAVWQYGRDCHPIMNDKDAEVTFNVNLVKNEDIIIKRMF